MDKLPSASPKTSRVFGVRCVRVSLVIPTPPVLRVLCAICKLQAASTVERIQNYHRNRATMRSSSHRISALLVAAVLLGTLTAVAAMSAEDCHTADMPVLCHGARVVRSVVDMRSMRIMDGVEIVRIADEGANNDSSGREAPADTGNAYVDRVLQYLRTHEIKISLNDWLQRSGMAEAFAGAMREAESANEVVGRLQGYFFIVRGGN